MHHCTIKRVQIWKENILSRIITLHDTILEETGYSRLPKEGVLFLPRRSWVHLAHELYGVAGEADYENPVLMMSTIYFPTIIFVEDLHKDDIIYCTPAYFDKLQESGLSISYIEEILGSFRYEDDVLKIYAHAEYI